jgi:hypothetical protein
MATPTNLPAAQTTGNVLTAAYMNDLRGAFRVLQVVSATTSTQISSTGADTDTGLTVTITPQSNTSKILIVAMHNGFGKVGNVYGSVYLKRGSTTISTIGPTLGNTVTTLTLIGIAANAIYLDSPATTSATTYKTTLQASGATAYMQTDGATSYMVAMEISA